MTHPGPLTGRRILVCGGATGIGAATARRLAHMGAAVIIQYRTRGDEAAALRTALQASGADVAEVCGDLTQESDVERVLDASDLLHGIVHSISPPLPRARFDKNPWAVYQQHWEAGVKALYLLATSAIARDLPLGAIVAVLSTAVVGVPPKDMAPYVAAKAGLAGFCRALAVELAPRKVRVNCVSPGLTPTPLTGHVDPRHHEILGRAVPLQRIATPDDTAGAIAFLMGPDAEFLTGVNLPVAGGASM
ncbi:MAG: SDR family oxidoreductase [Acidobacteriota bacterium]